ncbi:MAG: hypothetical protein IJA91_05420 [Clostridia bacterium]|nr:hypothetical protein [Clostridia bacterium]
MKKLSYVMAALLLIMGCMAVLSGCDLGAKAPEIPEGYQVYKNDALSFAYPEDWSANTGSVVTLMNPAGTGNNITVVYEAKTDMYDDLTAESFGTLMQPTYEAMGMKLSDVQVEKKTTNGLDVVQISYNAKLAGVSMSQTAFITTVGDSTYTVTVTEMTPDQELVKTVFETLYAVK